LSGITIYSQEKNIALRFEILEHIHYGQWIA